MAERKRSKDKSRDSEKILGDQTAISQQGRSGGDLARKVATRDEEKRSNERPAGVTRVTKQDEIDTGTDRKGE
ncbi:hypothetical protein LZG00_18965 [Rhodobacteraceae bacterium LMO-12]|nr:hypothetical protein [Rhodobacteraceae bacterium LMO-JJ12]